MSPTEIAFLALGLLLGTAVGAAIVQGMARRPVPRREVRLTIAPNAIPSRQGATLSDPRGISITGLMRGSPAALAFDEPADERPGGGSAGEVPGRTRVPSGPVAIPATAVAVPVLAPGAASGTAVATHATTAATAGGSVGLPSAREAGSRPAGGVALLEAPTVAAVSVVARAVVGVVVPLVEPADDPARTGPAVTPPEAVPTLVRPRPPVEPGRPVVPAAAVAVRVDAGPILRPIASVTPPGGGSGAPSVAQRGTDPCAAPRRLVEERCALADAARDQGRSAADALREAQRQYDVLRDRVDRAQLTADPRHIAAAKEQLHAEFRAASDSAGGPEETEAAARAWLQRINDLNADVRDAQRLLESGGADLRARLPVLDRLAAEADAARIAAENAEGGCRDAREQLASCEEAETRARLATPPPPEEPHPFEGVWPEEQPDLPEPVAPAARLTGLPVIVRVLRGEREARQRLVASLAAGEPDGEREWGLRISRLVDAIVARAIEDGYLDLPEDDPFWRLFERREARDIVGALSALGYRYDGMGGFADGRAPVPRDLSLAVGYAGLDRMRIRTWPQSAEIDRLYERAVVAADEWLEHQAGDLSLGRMVDALGNRAADLADVWNAWGRVRPALMAP